MNINEIVKYPILTEKTYAQMENRVYTFAVNKKANKKQIQKAVEVIFAVEIEKVNTQVVRRKDKRVGKFLGKTTGIKKAVVYLKEGHSISFYPDENTSDSPTQDKIVEDVKATKAKTTNTKKAEDDKKAKDVEARVAAKLAKKKETTTAASETEKKVETKKPTTKKTATTKKAVAKKPVAKKTVAKKPAPKKAAPKKTNTDKK